MTALHYEYEMHEPNYQPLSEAERAGFIATVAFALTGAVFGALIEHKRGGSIRRGAAVGAALGAGVLMAFAEVSSHMNDALESDALAQ